MDNKTREIAIACFFIGLSIGAISVAYALKDRCSQGHIDRGYYEPDYPPIEPP